MNYAKQYAAQFKRYLRREPRPSDGYEEAEVQSAESEIGFRLPAALREYYRTVGNARELNRAHNILFAPAEFGVRDGFLVFMEENQDVVEWGIKVSDVGEDDPEVWQCVDDDPPAWHSEEMPFSEFIERMSEFQLGRKNRQA